MVIIYNASCNPRNPEETRHAIRVADVIDDFGEEQNLSYREQAFNAANRFLFPGHYSHLES